MNSIWPWRGRVLQTLITAIADSPKILWRIVSALGLVFDVSHRQTNGTRATKRVWITGRDAAHLACMAISFENLGASLLRDSTPESRNALRSLKDILPRLQVPPVLMRKYLIALFIAKFSHPPSPFRCSTARLLNLSRFQNGTHVGQEKGADQFFRTLVFLGRHRLS